MGLAAMCVVAGVGALSAWLYPMTGKVQFSVSGEPVLVRRSKRGFEEALFRFDIDCDLSNIVFMNTRLFYAYILAEWQSGNDEKHSAILWNELIKKENPIFLDKDVPASFSFRQVGASMKGRPINLSFVIQQVPYVGFFKTKTLLQKEYTLPDRYGK